MVALSTNASTPYQRNENLWPGDSSRSEAPSQISDEVFYGTFAGKTVVILEQEGLTQMYLQKTLLRAGFQVIGQAQTWLEGLPLITQKQPDLVLFDLSLSKGLDVNRCLRILRTQAACIVLLSPFSDTVSRELTERYGAQGYLLKPLDRETFICYLQQICAHLQPV